MTIREKLSRNPSVAGGLAILCICIAAVAVYRYALGGATSRISALYSDDDGQAWFRDDLAKLPPFDHGGKPAYRAKVYSCAGHRFVAYLEYYTEADKAALQKSMKSQFLLLNMMQSYPPYVKRPGDKDWVAPRARKKYEAITTPVCPDGSKETPELVAAK